VACNSEKTHPIQQEYNKYRNIQGNNINHKIHAEIASLLKIRHLNIDWSKVEIYTYREHKNTGEKALAAPCQACRVYIQSLGIRNLYYTGNNNIIYERVVKYERSAGH
jgi:cytidine deaminase